MSEMTDEGLRTVGRAPSAPAQRVATAWSRGVAAAPSNAELADLARRIDAHVAHNLLEDRAAARAHNEGEE